jgi:hypothetical protein
MMIDELDRFHNELGIVLKANVPLELDVAGSRIGSRRHRLNLLSRYQQLVRQHFAAAPDHQNDSAEPAGSSRTGIESSNSKETSGQRPEQTLLASPLSELNRKIPVRFQAALRTYLTTRSFTPVLEGLTVRELARQQLRRIIRWPLFYLGVLVSLCIVGLYFFWSQVLPQITNFRADSPQPQIALSWDIQTWLPTLYLGFSIVAVLFLLLLLLGGFFRILMWLGGRRYVDSMSAATAQRIVPLLIHAGATPDQAVSLSYDLCGLSHRNQKVYLPNHRSVDHSAWLQGSEHWMLIADLQMIRLKSLFPMLIVTVVGGTIGFIYAVSIYGPVITMLRQLGST